MKGEDLPKCSPNIKYMSNNNSYNKSEEKHTIVDEMLDWGESFVFSLFIMLLIMIFAFKQIEVSGESMESTLSNGDRLLISNLFGSPEQGDVVVVNSKGLGKTVVKRVIATAGQTVIIDYDNDTVTVDDEIIKEDYLNAGSKNMKLSVLFGSEYMVSKNCYKYIVPDNCIFVLGDNRNNSTDSRFSSVGFVNLDDVMGTALFRIFPFGEMCKL